MELELRQVMTIDKVIMHVVTLTNFRHVKPDQAIINEMRDSHDKVGRLWQNQVATTTCTTHISKITRSIDLKQYREKNQDYKEKQLLYMRSIAWLCKLP